MNISGGKNLGSSEGEVKDSQPVTLQEPVVLKQLEITGNRYVTSTKLTTQLGARLVSYQNGVAVSTVNVSGSVTWSSSPWDWEQRRHANVSSSGLVSYSYSLNNYETTPAMYFPVTCTYTADGTTYTATEIVEYGETHFIKVWPMMKDSNGNRLQCPYAVLSEPAPRLFASYGSYDNMGQINVSSSWTGTNSNPDCPNSWQIKAGQTTWPNAGSSSEGPRFTGSYTYQVDYAKFNTTGSPTEYYDSSNKVMYYLLVQNSQDYWQQEPNTTPSSYTVMLLPVTEFAGQMIQRYTQEYYLAIRTNYEDKYEIPFRNMEFGQTRVWFGGDTYVNVEDVIESIELHGASGPGSGKLYPSTSELGTTYSGIHLNGFDIPWGYSPLYTFDSNYHGWYGERDFSTVTSADVVWNSGYGTTYTTNCIVYVDPNVTYFY